MDVVNKFDDQKFAILLAAHCLFPCSKQTSRIHSSSVHSVREANVWTGMIFDLTNS